MQESGLRTEEVLEIPDLEDGENILSAGRGSFCIMHTRPESPDPRLCNTASDLYASCSQVPTSWVRAGFGIVRNDPEIPESRFSDPWSLEY